MGEGEGVVFGGCFGVFICVGTIAGLRLLGLGLVYIYIVRVAVELVCCYNLARNSRSGSIPDGPS